MTKQIKVFFVFLAVLAVISVFSFFDIFNGVKSADLHDAIQPLPLGLEEDVDQDGLSNTDESYWDTDFQNPDTDGDGFLDGEEIASGNDPREKSSHPLGDSLEDTVYGTVKEGIPGDFEDINLTYDTSLLLAGGITAGDLSREADPEKQNTALSVLADHTLNNFYNSLPIFNPDTLTVVSDSVENQTKYLESLASIIKENLIEMPKKLDFDKNPFTQTDYFRTRAERFKLSANSASSLIVPKNWVETHGKIVDLLNHFYLNYSAIANYDTDSVKAIISFNDVENLNNLIKDVLEEVQEKIKTNNLRPKDLVFAIMDIIY